MCTIKLQADDSTFTDNQGENPTKLVALEQRNQLLWNLL